MPMSRRTVHGRGRARSSPGAFSSVASSGTSSSGCSSGSAYASRRVATAHQLDGLVLGQARRSFSTFPPSAEHRRSSRPGRSPSLPAIPKSNSRTRTVLAQTADEAGTDPLHLALGEHGGGLVEDQHSRLAHQYARGSSISCFWASGSCSTTAPGSTRFQHRARRAAQAAERPAARGAGESVRDSRTARGPSTGSQQRYISGSSVELLEHRGDAAPQGVLRSAKLRFLATDQTPRAHRRDGSCPLAL